MAMTTRGKSAVNWILLGFILLGLGGFGVHSFSTQSTGSIGSVGDVELRADDYARQLQQQLQAIQAQTGQPVSAETARAMGLPQQVQGLLITAAALQAEAEEIGVSVGDRRVAEQIRGASAFRGPTGFDRDRYDEILRREGLNEERFEREVRIDLARQLQEGAVKGATVPPVGTVAMVTRWLTETRDLTWSEVTPEALPAPVTAPDEATLKAWYDANPARFTAPETRHISYAWLTPQMLEGSVQLDEAALRAAYDERRDEYQQPARRLVDRLVYPDLAAATAAKTRLDAGTASFDTLVTERGLDRAAIDQGEVTEAQLGPAGAAVFAAPDNGVVGPVESEVGPALFSVNAIMDPIDISFEAARDDLRTEAAADKARRDIEAQTPQISDELAGGATLADLAKDTPMQTGSIDWQADAPPAQGSIAGYPEFRTAAAAATIGAFPDIQQLGDGGIFALTLDRVTPPALIPFDEARDRVVSDWIAAETTKQLLARAGQDRDAAVAAAASGGQAAGSKAPGLGRNDPIDGVPAEVVTRGFALAKAGDSAVVEADNRVFVVSVDAIHEADPAAPQVVQTAQAVESRAAETLAEDYLEFYGRALTTAHGLTLDQRAIAAVDARIQ